MKRLLLLLAATSLVLAPAAHAAKGDRKKAAANTEATAGLLKKYDTNANGKIDGDELEAVRKDFTGTSDEALKALDKDHDGKLSDTEIAALGGTPKKIKKKKP